MGRRARERRSGAHNTSVAGEVYQNVTQGDRCLVRVPAHRGRAGSVLGDLER
jgi:hypothetical protein